MHAREGMPSPMVITGGAKIFSIYTSQAVFNGEVQIKISTDGKILIIGKLNFGDGALSISGRLYADLSRVDTGRVTILFLADVPDQVRLLTLKTAWLIDTVGVFGAMKEISAIKVAAPNVALRIIDQAMQMHGGAGLSEDVPLAAMYAAARILRLADGPDEVHRGLVARWELMPFKDRLDAYRGRR